MRRTFDVLRARWPRIGTGILLLSASGVLVGIGLSPADGAETLSASASAPTGCMAVPTPGTGEPMGMNSEFDDPTGMPAGVNGTSSCAVSQPYPVVLVHGTFANANFSWQTIAPTLVDDGYSVWALDYGATSWTTQSNDRVYAVDSVANSAAELAYFIDDVVIPRTGATQVDVVGHSQGGMMPRYFIEHDWNCTSGSVTTNAYGESACTAIGSDTSDGADSPGSPGPQCTPHSSVAGAACVHILVGFAPSNHGASAYGLVSEMEQLFGQNTQTYPEELGCGACADQESASPFLQALNAPEGPNGANGEAIPGVLYYVIESADDEVVTPAPDAATEELGYWPSAFLMPGAGGPDIQSAVGTANWIVSSQIDNVTLQGQCPTDNTDHIGIIYDPLAVEDMVSALSDNGSSVVALPSPALTSCPVVPPLVSG